MCPTIRVVQPIPIMILGAVTMSEAKERRYKAVLITPDLLYTLMTVGTPIYIQCVEGLPKDARFITQAYDILRDVHSLIFESDEWEPVPFGEIVPTQRVAHRQFHILSLLERAESLIGASYDSAATQWLEEWREWKGKTV